MIQWFYTFTRLYIVISFAFLYKKIINSQSVRSSLGKSKFPKGILKNDLNLKLSASLVEFLTGNIQTETKN